MANTTMEGLLPPTRCRAEVKSRLWVIAQNSITKTLSDHIRLAVERYVEEEEKRMGIVPPLPEAAAAVLT